MKYKILFTIGLICMIEALPASPLHSDNYHLTQLSSNEGLSQQDVECLIQDHTGFIWIATYDGLNMYDGNSFTIFRHIPNDSNSISDNRIVALKEWASRNEIWVGTDGGGLNCYNTKNQSFTHIFCNKKESQDIKCLDFYNETLWVGSVDGLSSITFTEGNKMKITPFALKGITGRKNNQLILSIGHDRQGNTIVSTDDGLYCKAPSEKYFTLMTENSGIKQIIQDKRGNLWGVSPGQLCFYPVQQQQGKGYLSFPQRLSIGVRDAGDLKSILPVNEQLAIINTSKKLFFIRLSDHPVSFEEIRITHPAFFENNDLKSLMLDNSMNVWISSAMDGVAHFDLNEKKIYPYPLGNEKALDKLFVQAMTKDGKNRLWIGSGSGCFLLNGTTGESNKINAANEQIYGLLTDQESNVWGTSLTGILFFQKGDETKMLSLKNHPGLPRDMVMDGPYSLCEDTRNRIIWVGLRSGILQVKYDKGHFSFRFYKKDLFSKPYFSNVTKLLLDEERHVLLIGTSTEGLYKARLSEEGNLLHAEPIQTGDSKEHIWTMFKASDGRIYMGTDTGLKELTADESGNYQSITVSGGDKRLQTYKITSILEDDDSNLWLSTGFGLLCYHPETQEIKQYVNTDGLSSKILTEGAFYDSSTKTLYVGSIKGVNVVELSSLYMNEIPPKTVIRDIKINNTSIRPNEPFNGRIFLTQSLTYAQSLELKHFENNITIDFASLHYSNPNKNRFMYQLEGFSEEWLETNGGHTATFTNLPHGIYTFRVKSANSDGVWEDEPARMTIKIFPAPWNTAWAYLLYLTIISTILFFVYRYLSDKRKHKHALLLEQLEHQKKMEIAEVKLKYHTNITHELRTPLSLIIAPVDELIANSYEDKFLNSRLDIIKSNADRLLRLVSQFLDFRKIINEKYELRVKKINLYEALLSVRKSFSASAAQKEISLELFYDMTFDSCWCDVEIVNKICYNLLANAIKYTPDKGKISIYATTNPDNSILYLSIEDTGIGIEEKELDKIFNRFYQAPGSAGGTGIGLDLCRQLTMIHHGQIKVKSRPGEGTLFTVELPITRDAYSETEIFEDEAPGRTPPAFTEENNDWQGSRDKPIVLLVEDNFELRSYMSSLLSDHAKILVAGNGEEGYKMAFNHVPDIIVSDIMMPVMDGIELTQKCKSEMVTSHIPVILLTAKDGIESEIEGLTYGADDYIRKPFNPTTLKLKINNFIKLTRKKEDANTQEPAKKLNERELSFLNTFEKMVLENISTPEFGVDDICRLMFISRMQLYRKMSMIINKKPSQYIKEIKMKKAYEFIREKGYNITETMYAVGYTSYTHFSHLFGEVNGETPRKMLGMKEKD